jgi:ADP-ribose pyrophosphatase YjhB (NUDIX family)
MNYYSGHDKLYVAVDCIIFGFDQETLKILLIKRRMEPFKDQWSLMGGFVKENEGLDDAAKRITTALTGLDQVYLEQLFTFGDINRDPGGRIISVSYFALIKIDDSNTEILNQNGAEWFSVKDYPELIFDHTRMIDTALNRLRRRCGAQPIGFELLPEKFTIPQLQSLYEAIFMTSLDKRNFRKKILDMNLLDKLEEKDRRNSKKGAYFYRFNKEKYLDFTQKGFRFEV